MDPVPDRGGDARVAGRDGRPERAAGARRAHARAAAPAARGGRHGRAAGPHRRAGGRRAAAAGAARLAARGGAAGRVRAAVHGRGRGVRRARGPRAAERGRRRRARRPRPRARDRGRARRGARRRPRGRPGRRRRARPPAAGARGVAAPARLAGGAVRGVRRRPARGALRRPRPRAADGEAHLRRLRAPGLRAADDGGDAHARGDRGRAPLVSGRRAPRRRAAARPARGAVRALPGGARVRAQAARALRGGLRLDAPAAARRREHPLARRRAGAGDRRARDRPGRLAPAGARAGVGVRRRGVRGDQPGRADRFAQRRSLPGRREHRRVLPEHAQRGCGRAAHPPAQPRVRARGDPGRDLARDDGLLGANLARARARDAVAGLPPPVGACTYD